MYSRLYFVFIRQEAALVSPSRSSVDDVAVGYCACPSVCNTATELGGCYAEYSADGRCVELVRRQTTISDCCCTATGRAWSDARSCQPCPAPHSGITSVFCSSL